MFTVQNNENDCIFVFEEIENPVFLFLYNTNARTSNIFCIQNLATRVKIRYGVKLYDIRI